MGFPYGGLTDVRRRLAEAYTSLTAPVKPETVMEMRCDALLRTDVIVAQVLPAVVEAFRLTYLAHTGHMFDRMGPSQPGAAHNARQFWRQVDRCGFLVGFECLLSTAGHEAGMLSDFAGAVQCLQRVKLRLVQHAPAGHAPSVALRSTAVGPCDHDVDAGLGQHGATLVVDVHLGDAYPFQLLPRRLGSGGAIDVVPVLLTQGVNERQTSANLAHNNRLQQVVNLDSLQRLAAYAAKCHDAGVLGNADTANDVGAVSGPAAAAVSPPSAVDAPQSAVEFGTLSHNALPALLLRVWRQFASRKLAYEKNVTMLQCFDELVRGLRGGRCVSCKSAKDRTSMAVTLESTRAMVATGHLPAAQQAWITKVLRVCGVRRDNVEKNTGSPQYAFNVFQTSTLPKEYRPPKGTGGSSLT